MIVLWPVCPSRHQQPLHSAPLLHLGYLSLSLHLPLFPVVVRTYLRGATLI